MATVNAKQYLAHNMTDAECAVADALVDAGLAEATDMTKAVAVALVRFLGKHGWLLTRQTED